MAGPLECSQALFALRTLRHHGLSDTELQLTFSYKVLSKLAYASPAWWGFTSVSAKNQIEALIKKATKFGYYPDHKPNFTQIILSAKELLFHKITSNPYHCLHQLLPPTKNSSYNLRKRGHNYSLPLKDDRNFMNRILFRLL